MMKAAAFTIAMLLGGTAIAQTDTTSSTTTDTTATTTDTSTTWSNTATTTPAATPMAAANPMAPASGQTVAPDNSNPERDARGIAVISAPAVVPAGWNNTASALTGTGGPELDASGQPVTTAASDLPPCSRTVTDHCVQTYERNRR